MPIFDDTNGLNACCALRTPQQGIAIEGKRDRHELRAGNPVACRRPTTNVSPGSCSIVVRLPYTGACKGRCRLRRQSDLEFRCSTELEHDPAGSCRRGPLECCARRGAGGPRPENRDCRLQATKPFGGGGCGRRLCGGGGVVSAAVGRGGRARGRGCELGCRPSRRAARGRLHHENVARSTRRQVVRRAGAFASRARRRGRRPGQGWYSHRQGERGQRVPVLRPLRPLGAVW